MKKQVYQQEILEKMNPDGTVTCEVCGIDSMIAHAFVDHSSDTVKIMCHDCYLKRLSREEN